MEKLLDIEALGYVSAFFAYLAGVGYIAKTQNRSMLFWIIFCLFMPGIGLFCLAYCMSQQTVKCPLCGRVFPVRQHTHSELANAEFNPPEQSEAERIRVHFD